MRIVASSVRQPRPRLLFALVVFSWLCFAGASVVLAWRDFGAGENAANRARAALAPTQLIAGSAERDLATASRSFRQGQRRLRQPLLLPLRKTPFVGRQLTAAITVGGAAADLSKIGAKAARQARRAVGHRIAPGSDRVAALERLSTISTETEHALGRVSLGRGERLLGPLDAAHATLVQEVARTRDALRRTATTTSGLARVLRGPRTYLLLAANNAEMRAGSGMFLSAGLLTVADGELHLSEMRSTSAMHLPGAGVPVEGDQAVIWGWTNPGREWRSLGMTPRFEATAPLAARMWENLTGGRVDGVLALDVVALRALLTATGPVQVDGVGIGEENVERYLLHDQYHSIAHDESFEATQAARRERLSDIARVAIGAVQRSQVDLTLVGARLAHASRGRHLLLWSGRSEDQAAWEAADVSGKMAANSLLLSLANRGGNKLDQFLRVEATISSREVSRGAHDVTVSVRLRNFAPQAGPRYVTGPHPELDVREGTYVGVMALTVPRDAERLAFGGGVTANITAADGPTRVIVTEVRLARGEERTLVSTFRLPRRQPALVVEPSARVPPVLWRLGDDRWYDHGRRTVVLQRGHGAVVTGRPAHEVGKY